MSYLKTDTDMPDKLQTSFTDQQRKLVNKITRKLRTSGLIVPVIGDDMLEWTRDDGSKGNVKDFICDYFGIEADDDANLVGQTIRDSYYFGIELLESDGNHGLVAELHSAFSDAVNEGKLRPKECVRDFLRAYNFPLVITTFGFPILEKEKSLWYNPTGRNDFPVDYSDGCQRVYHIFGGNTASNWAYNENTLLKFMHSLHSTDYGAKSLANYLRGGDNENPKQLLVLGSYLPDWLYRFLVYPMYEEKMRDTSGFWLSADMLEESLRFFLTKYQYECCAGLPCDSIIKQINAVGNRQHPPVSNVRLNCFVSYKRPDTEDDKAKLSRIKDILSQQSNALWVDYEQIKMIGENYWQMIKDAVRNCNRFVALVCNDYLDDFADAPDLNEIIRTHSGLHDAKTDEEPDVVKSLKPVVREALYCLLYEKTCCPIVYNHDGCNLTSGEVEAVANDTSDKRNLPQSMFVGRNMADYDDNTPRPFNL